MQRSHGGIFGLARAVAADVLQCFHAVVVGSARAAGKAHHGVGGEMVACRDDGCHCIVGVGERWQACCGVVGVLLLRWRWWGGDQG